MEIDEGARWAGGGGSKVSKEYQILAITNTIASLDTFEGTVKSVKSVLKVRMRRCLNGD